MVLKEKAVGFLDNNHSQLYILVLNKSVDNIESSHSKIMTC